MAGGWSLWGAEGSNGAKATLCLERGMDNNKT